MKSQKLRFVCPFLVGFIFLVVFEGCSPSKAALRILADALGSGSASSFKSEDDIELVCESLPFALKSMESLHKKVSDHKGLCLSLVQGYMLYTYGKVETEAEYLKKTDYTGYKKARTRIANLYHRAYDYGMSGLRLVDEDFIKKYRKNHKEGLSLVKEKEDVPLLYWTGAALAKWISFSKDNPSAVVQLPAVREFMERALAFDLNYDNGAIHELLVTYERFATGDSAQAMMHYSMALNAAEGKKTSIFLTYVEAFAIPGHDEKAFDSYLQKILAFDIDKAPDYRLANAITRQKAEILLSKREEFFLGDGNEE